ncbi:efflux transporter outer membrane subunit [Adhaeretor mobilis]|nr:efflux transporter outer membrane subunit [Adhaeretor mobilis]
MVDHFWLVLVCLTLLSVGCTSPREWIANGFKVGPEYCTPCVEVAEDWIDADDRRILSDPVDHAAWWTSFNDPVLNQLVAEAYRQNLTLREAGERISEARALRAITVGNVFPQQQDVSASYSHNLPTGTGFDRHFSTWTSSFNLAWELDFWGRYRRAVDAADADLESTVYDYGDVVVTLVADVAATYVDIRTLQTRLELAKRNVENQRNTYELTENLFLGGELSDIDVQQAKSSLAQTETLIPQLQVTLRQTQNQLCVLLGIPPRDLIARLGEGDIPTVAPDVALGIPAATLLQRPDVRRAERELAAQSALIGVAESELYPIITLRGNVGVAANQFDDLFRNGSSFGSIGPSLRWNILNYGRILNGIDVQDARLRQLVHRYRQSVLLANLEAENAIIQFLKSQVQLKLELEAAKAADKTNELITLQLKEGEADINRVFNVQNFKTQQELSAALTKGEVAQSLIAIYRALGGGWPSPFLGEAIVEINPVSEPKEAEEETADLEQLPPPNPEEELPQEPAPAA